MKQLKRIKTQQYKPNQWNKVDYTIDLHVLFILNRIFRNSGKADGKCFYLLFFLYDSVCLFIIFNVVFLFNDWSQYFFGSTSWRNTQKCGTHCVKVLSYFE